MKDMKYQWFLKRWCHKSKTINEFTLLIISNNVQLLNIFQIDNAI